MHLRGKLGSWVFFRSIAANDHKVQVGLASFIFIRVLGRFDPDLSTRTESLLRCDRAYCQTGPFDCWCPKPLERLIFCDQKLKTILGNKGRKHHPFGFSTAMTGWISGCLKANKQGITTPSECPTLQGFASPTASTSLSIQNLDENFVSINLIIEKNVLQLLCKKGILN